MRDYEKKYCCNDIEYSENELTQAIAFAAEILKDGIFYAENSGDDENCWISFQNEKLHELSGVNSWAAFIKWAEGYSRFEIIEL